MERHYGSAGNKYACSTLDFFWIPNQQLVNKSAHQLQLIPGVDDTRRLSIINLDGGYLVAEGRVNFACLAPENRDPSAAAHEHQE